MFGRKRANNSVSTGIIILFLSPRLPRLALFGTKLEPAPSKTPVMLSTSLKRNWFSKCQKMKNAGAKRAKILFFIVKYANMWGFCCIRRRDYFNYLFPTGNLRFDDGKVNDNATNHWFDWLNKEKQSCCTCGTLVGAMLWRSLPNDDVKFSHLRFWRQRELAAVNLFALSWKPFVPCKRKCSSPILYNVINTE